MYGRIRKKAALLLSAVITVGVALLGWGTDDVRGFMAHPARAGLMISIPLLSALAALTSKQISSGFSKGAHPVGPQRLVLPGMIVVSVGLWIFLPYGDRREVLVFPAEDWVRYLGLMLAVAGMAIRFMGLRELGRQFSVYVTLQEDHKLVQSGIYGVLRHPLYLGAIFAMVGIALVFRSWLIIPGSVLVNAFVLVRISREEKLLAEHFKVEFAAYRRRTWRLLPYIY